MKYLFAIVPGIICTYLLGMLETNAIASLIIGKDIFIMWDD